MPPIEIDGNLVELALREDGDELTVELRVYRDGEFAERHEISYSRVEEWRHEDTTAYAPKEK